MGCTVNFTTIHKNTPEHQLSVHAKISSFLKTEITHPLSELIFDQSPLPLDPIKSGLLFGKADKPLLCQITFVCKPSLLPTYHSFSLPTKTDANLPFAEFIILKAQDRILGTHRFYCSHNIERDLDDPRVIFSR